MNPTVDPRQMTPRLYRNMELMFGRYVRDLQAGANLADLGCGTGFLLYWLAGHQGLRVHGVDACESQTSIASMAVPSANIAVGDIRDFLRTSHRKYTVIFCMDVLEHMETDDICFEAMRDILAALEPGGVLICRVPNAAHILGTYSRYIDITHRRSFTSHSLHQALTAAGFASVEFVPTQSSILLGKVRLRLENLLHRALYLLGGYTQERIFTQNVIAAARKSGS